MDERGSAGGPSEGCRQFDLELEAYLEGESRPQVEEHARSCPFCHSVLADLEQILAMTRHLTGEDEPPARLWTNVRAVLIQEGIIRERRRWWSAGFWLRPVPAVLAAALVVLGLALWKPSAWFSSHTHRRGISPASAPWLAPGAELSVPSEYQEMASAVDEMQKAYEAQSASLDPMTKASFENGLRSLDDEIRECAHDVQQEPADTEARQYLVTAYRAKAEVLESALEYTGR